MKMINQPKYLISNICTFSFRDCKENFVKTILIIQQNGKAFSNNLSMSKRLNTDFSFYDLIVTLP